MSPLIQITQFEDVALYLHVATLLGRRDYLRDDEYNVTARRYADYLEINHPNGWYTPFDPRLEMRKADFGSFKKMAKSLFAADATAAAEWIRANTHQFSHPRTFHTIEELAMKLNGIRHERNVENERPATGVGV